MTRLDTVTVRLRINTRKFMRMHRVRCYEIGGYVGQAALRCFGSIHHPGEHVF